MRKKTILFLSLAAFLLISTGCSVLSQPSSLMPQQGNQPPVTDPAPQNGREQGSEQNPGNEKAPGTVPETENGNGNGDTLTATWAEYSNFVLPIYDRENREIGSITCCDYSNLTDQGILYTRYPEGEEKSDGKRVEYHLYDVEKKEDHYLTTIDDWYYSASYEAVEKDDHLYLSVATGDYVERKDRTLTLYDIDLERFTMDPLLVVEGGIPYDSYTIAGDKLYFTELVDNGGTDLITIDLKNKPEKPIYHAYNENEVFVNSSVRRILADDEYVYMLILRWENENYGLDLDTYDHDLKRLKTVDITDTCVSTLYENDRNESQNEIMQFVCDLFLKDGLFFYRNFSVTTFLGLLSDDGLERLADTDDLIAEVGSVYEDRDLLLLRMYGEDSANRDMRNLFYRIDPEDHRIRKAEFYSDNVLYTFRGALQDSRGRILLNVGYVPDDRSVTVPNRLYYLDLQDLNFENVD